MPTHPIPRYTFLALQFNMLLDQGEAIPIDEAHERIADGSLLDWLDSHYGKEPHYLDLSPYEKQERQTILGAFKEISEGVDESRKLAVSHNGIALCLAYCIEILQHPDDFPN